MDTEKKTYVSSQWFVEIATLLNPENTATGGVTAEKSARAKSIIENTAPSDAPVVINDGDTWEISVEHWRGGGRGCPGYMEYTSGWFVTRQGDILYLRAEGKARKSYLGKDFKNSYPK